MALPVDMALTLVLGPRRSGKSDVAERLASRSGDAVVYVAPLTAVDAEMRARVAAHRARRPSAWTTVETADVAAALRDAPPEATVLLDSLGTWVAEVLWRAGALDGESDGGESALRLERELGEVARIASERDGDVVIVAEEAGWGPVPPAAGTRLWLDLLGDGAQALAKVADRVLLVVAGRVLELP